jgi:hypothetical protein
MPQILRTPTDTSRPNVTSEAKVAQGITELLAVIHPAGPAAPQSMPRPEDPNLQVVIELDLDAAAAVSPGGIVYEVAMKLYLSLHWRVTIQMWRTNTSGQAQTRNASD